MREINKPSVGLLPLYLELYDETSPNFSPMMRAFADETANRLESAGLKVYLTPVCRIESEFRAAVHAIEEAGAESIVTLHLAYSPSLECIDALMSTKLPVIVFDTTPTYDFAEKQDSTEVMANHGIHGVQDMCSMLRRRKKLYWVEAGHMDHSDVLERVAKRARAASAAAAFRRARIGIIGKPFKGMGDFYVSADELRSSLGATVTELDAGTAKALANSITQAEITREADHYKEVFSLHTNVGEGIWRSRRSLT